MEMYCADCGCLVEGGVRIVSCGTDSCCCLELPLASQDVLAEKLRTSFNARDIDTLRSLLAQGAIWGEDPEGESFCHNRNDIIANIKRLLNDGVNPSIVDTTTGPRGIAAHVEVEWPDPADARPDRISFYQVYVVTDGLVTEIHVHDDAASAFAAISH